MIWMLVALGVALVAACVVLSVFSGDEDLEADEGQTRLQDLLDP